MTFDKNASIRYLMKEMDPSEEMLFEKEMLNDENLLIEVESLRKVYNRISDLPPLSVPDHVLDRVVTDAVNRTGTGIRRTRTLAFAWSVAATVLLTLFAGLFWSVMNPDSGDATGEIHQASAPGAQNAPVPDAASSPLQVPETSAASSLVTPDAGLTPWVDQDNILHFSDRLDATHTSAFDSIFQNSYQKLEPIQRIEGSSGPGRTIQMTGN
ncbi:MAG: hypothetical protein WDZ29_00190 [Balneolaceae bacterium]